MATVCSRDHLRHRFRRRVVQNIKEVTCPGYPDEEDGFYNITTTSPPFEEIERAHEELLPGGRWQPKRCQPSSRVAIIVPYRDRAMHLRRFLHHIHGFLQAQQLQYTIFVIEQGNGEDFNRGFVKNVGYREAMEGGRYDCVIFHDVDLLPENLHNSYGCPETTSARHMCIAISYFDYVPLTNGAVFGGIVAMGDSAFRSTNGYSNLYFGWGGEDDDLYARANVNNVSIQWISPVNGRYKGLTHAKKERNQYMRSLIIGRRERMRTDGLTSLEYTVTHRVQYRTFTWIKVHFNYTKYQNEMMTFLTRMKNMEYNKITGGLLV